MKKVLLSALLVVGMTFPALGEILKSENGSLTVEASGRGRTLTAAKINARRDAARQALGFILEGTSLYTELTSDSGTTRTLSEKVIRLSRAFIGAGEQVLSQTEDNRHIFSVTMRMNVSGSELLNGLMQKGAEKSSLDGLSMVASAMAREQWKNEVSGALAEVFGTFPVSDYLRVTAEPVGEFDIKSSELRLKLSMKFDRQRYFSEAVPQLLAVLDYVAEARMTDIPFILPAEQSDNDTITISPPDPVKTMRQYLRLMEMETENRSIRPSGSANVYIQTRDYYFNAYRVVPEAFGKMIEAVFKADSRGNLLTKQGFGELKIEIAGENGRTLPITPMNISNLNNIIFFMDTASLALHPWVVNMDLYDEQHHAIFILPAFGFENEDGRDFSLYQEENAELPPQKVSAEELMSLGNGSVVQCSVVLK